jgi:hypothetical protein
MNLLEKGAGKTIEKVSRLVGSFSLGSRRFVSREFSRSFFNNKTVGRVVWS